MAQPQAPNQIFSQVVVRSSDIQDVELQEKVANRMMAFEQAKMERVNSDISLMRSTAERLRAQAAELEAKAALHETFAEGDTRCALESNWDFFRDNKGNPCAENYLSERDQRNMMRAQKASMNRTLEQQQSDGSQFNDMFERGGEA